MSVSCKKKKKKLLFTLNSFNVTKNNNTIKN